MRRRRFVSAMMLVSVISRPADAASARSRIAALERRAGGRLGVFARDTGSGATIAYRDSERFPMCSTFKLLAAGAILARVDAGRDQLDRRIRFTAADLMAYSPITKPQADGAGMTLAELCAAAIDYSDNTAANLLLAALGGPAALTAYARTLGDPVTRLDRNEPDLNQAIPGDPRDTTTPAAMLADVQRLALGDFLSPASREKLIRWLLGNTTGDKRLRAGLPAGWRVADKTGTGDYGSTNDIGLIWPPDRAPILVTAYLTGTDAPPDRRDATLAAVGRAVAVML